MLLGLRCAQSSRLILDINVLQWSHAALLWRSAASRARLSPLPRAASVLQVRFPPHGMPRNREIMLILIIIIISSIRRLIVGSARDEGQFSGVRAVATEAIERRHRWAERASGNSKRAPVQWATLFHCADREMSFSCSSAHCWLTSEQQDARKWAHLSSCAPVHLSERWQRGAKRVAALLPLLF